MNNKEIQYFLDILKNNISLENIKMDSIISINNIMKKKFIFSKKTHKKTSIPESHDKIKKIIDSATKSIDNATKSIDNETNKFIGAYIKLREKNRLIGDINQMSLKQIYPKLFSILYHNSNIVDNYEYLISIIDNKKIIIEYINDVNIYEQDSYKKLLNIYINYQFGLLNYNNNKKISLYIIYMQRYILSDIYDNDEFNDIIYIDTDSIYYVNTIETTKYIKKSINNIFDYDMEYCNLIYFIEKKKYIILNENNKMRGLRKMKYYENKQIKNISYSLFCSDNIFDEHKSFSGFVSKNILLNKYYDKAKTIFNRTDKLKTILNK